MLNEIDELYVREVLGAYLEFKIHHHSKLIDFDGFDGLNKSNEDEIIEYKQGKQYWNELRTDQLAKIIFNKNIDFTPYFYNDILQYISCIVRHKSYSQFELFHLIDECYGAGEVLFTPSSKLGNRYLRFMKEVKSELHRMCMFVRPEVYEKILVVEIKPTHKNEKHFCYWLSKKNPDLLVGIKHLSYSLLGNAQLLGFNETVIIVNSNIIAELKNNKVSSLDAEEIWDVYYNSQFINSRRNKQYAKQMQPKYSSKFSKMAKKDRYKVEKSTHSVTLDFFCNNKGKF